MSANAQTMNGGAVERHPKGLAVLFATEMWERFSFYSMLALFTLYLRDPKEGFGWTAAEATWLYSTYLMFVYASPLIGGFIADRFTGYRKAVMIGGFFFMAGHATLSIPAIWAVYLALTFLVIGNGFFKRGQPFEGSCLQHLLHGHQRRRRARTDMHGGCQGLFRIPRSVCDRGIRDGHFGLRLMEVEKPRYECGSEVGRQW